MKKLTFLFTAICVSLGATFAQEKKVEDVKTGWGFGVLPAVSFDTDLGFQYGGLVNFYDYGDGSAYPGYEHSIYLEASRYTKGSGIYRFYYDSEYLIPGIQITSDISYLPDEAYDFYGFNGYESVFNSVWIDDEHSDYRSRMFYKMKNNIFRFKTDVQIPLLDKSFRAIAGFNLLNFNIDRVDIEKLNKGKDDNLLPTHEQEPGLYQKYQEWGLITDEEADGGFVPVLKAGLVYDTRDNLPNPMKGLWTEAFLLGAPEFLGAESSFLKLNITHRQYFTIIEDDLSFAYRIGYQGTLSGKTPFYYQPQIATSVMKGARSEGLGGGKTLRGIKRNRVVGDGFAYGNAELRWKAVYFNFINQKWYLGVNAFMDAGQVVQKLDVEKVLLENGAFPPLEQSFLTVVQMETLSSFDFQNEEKLHISYGLGIRISMNQNFIIACDYGRAVDPQDGDSGIYIGLNYLF